MQTTRMSRAMRTLLEIRLDDLDARVKTLHREQEVDKTPDNWALLSELSNERDRIAKTLERVTLIDDQPFDTDAIEVGDAIKVRDEDGDIECYVLVEGDFGSRIRTNWVSVSSPLGARLLGSRKGDRIRVESAAGTATYVILAFERASDIHTSDPTSSAPCNA
jgi:transcription elongation GreA/GreB family factor